jgi:hypothetical protein
MKKELLSKILKHFVDKSSLVNKTNATTGAGAVMLTIAAALQTYPEPNAQLAGYLLGAIGLVVSTYTDQK